MGSLLRQLELAHNENELQKLVIQMDTNGICFCLFSGTKIFNTTKR